MDLAAIGDEVDRVERLHRAEALAEAADFEQRAIRSAAQEGEAATGSRAGHFGFQVVGQGAGPPVVGAARLDELVGRRGVEVDATE